MEDWNAETLDEARKRIQHVRSLNPLHNGDPTDPVDIVIQEDDYRSSSWTNWYECLLRATSDVTDNSTRQSIVPQSNTQAESAAMEETTQAVDYDSPSDQHDEEPTAVRRNTRSDVSPSMKMCVIGILMLLWGVITLFASGFRYEPTIQLPSHRQSMKPHRPAGTESRRDIESILGSRCSTHKLSDEALKTWIYIYSCFRRALVSPEDLHHPIMLV